MFHNIGLQCRFFRYPWAVDGVNEVSILDVLTVSEISKFIKRYTLYFILHTYLYVILDEQDRIRTSNGRWTGILIFCSNV